MIKLYGFKYSTNCERVALALAHKGLDHEEVHVDPYDRWLVNEVSGQDLVPVIEDDSTIVHDSTWILYYLENQYPDNPLFPDDPVRREELGVFIDWFNWVWKVPPNAIEDELDSDNPDTEVVARLGDEMTNSLYRFEALLEKRDWLWSDEMTVADVIAFPFLKYGHLGLPDDDDWLFHEILVRYLPVGDDHPRVQAWIERMNELPRVTFDAL